MSKHFSGILKKLKSIKHIEIIIAILFALIILLVYFSSTASSNTVKNNTPTTSTSVYASEVENRLASLISEIDGAGKVKVMVMCENESNTATTPKVISAVVVSSGAGNIAVKLEIIKAVQALLHIDCSNIEVLNGGS